MSIRHSAYMKYCREKKGGNLGRGVKSALLKGKNRVVDYLVTTVVCTLCANNAVFPLQQRAFYPRSGNLSSLYMMRS